MLRQVRHYHSDPTSTSCKQARRQKHGSKHKHPTSHHIIVSRETFSNRQCATQAVSRPQRRPAAPYCVRRRRCASGPSIGATVPLCASRDPICPSSKSKRRKQTNPPELKNCLFIIVMPITRRFFAPYQKISIPTTGHPPKNKKSSPQIFKIRSQPSAYPYKPNTTRRNLPALYQC